MNSRIFPMDRNDLEAVGRLSDQLGYLIEKPVLLARFNELLQLSHHGLFIIKEPDILGWIHLEVVHDLIEEKKVEIKALVIEENARGHGLGKELIEAAKKWTQDKGFDKIYLSCNINRDKTHAFYLKEGFKKVKTSFFFEINI